MRKYIIIILILISNIITSFAGDTLSSKVIIYRMNNLSGSAKNYKIYANDSLVTRMKNNSYYIYNCIAGKINFNIEKLKNTQIQLNVETGKTYYLRLVVNSGMWTSTPELIIVDSLNSYTKIFNGNLTKIEISNVPFNRHKNRIGINIGYGIGIDNNTVASTTDGNNASISFGGGLSFGLKYGYEYKKYIDLAVDANYQISFLLPYLRNASINFDRGYLSLTPSYIFLFKNKEDIRIKAGAGPDLYWNSKIIVNTDSLTSGFNNTYLYSKAIGFHTSINFEKDINEKISINLGVKYYYVRYQVYYDNKLNQSYDKPASDHDIFFKPNGSGLDFIIGLNYHF